MPKSRGQEWTLGAGPQGEALGRQRQGTEEEGRATQSELCQQGSPWDYLLMLEGTSSGWQRLRGLGHIWQGTCGQLRAEMQQPDP